MRILITLIIILLNLNPIDLFSQKDNAIVFTGKVISASTYRNSMTSIDVKIDSVLWGTFDSLDCKDLIKITNLPFSTVPKYITDTFGIYLNKGSSKASEYLDTSQSRLFFIKDSLLGWNEITKDTCKDCGFNFSSSIHECYYPSYDPYAALWCLNKSLTKTNYLYYDYKGVGNDTIEIDLKNKILPSFELELSFNADKISDKFVIIEPTNKILFSSDNFEGSMTNVRIPLDKINCEQLQLIIISSRKKSKWYIKYRFYSDIFK